MLVILKETMGHLGGMGEEVQVDDGYARNFLIPKKFAVEATSGNRISFQNEVKQKRKKLEKLKLEAQGLAGKIGALKMVFIKKSGEEGKLFGSVTSQEIADKMNEMGIEFDKKKIEIEKPIKTLGMHMVKGRLHPEVLVDINIEVVADEPVETKEEAESPEVNNAP